MFIKFANCLININFISSINLEDKDVDIHSSFPTKSGKGFWVYSEEFESHDEAEERFNQLQSALTKADLFISSNFISSSGGF